MSQDDFFLVRVSVPPPPEHSVSFFVPAPMEKRRKETLEVWKEIAPTLSSATRELAQKFVDTCERKGAFYCAPQCHVDVIEDDQVMFDWNNGQFPIFTVLIGSDYPQVSLVGKFEEGKVTSEAASLEFLEPPLDKLVKEIGNPAWTTTFSLDSLTREVNAVSGAGVLPSIPLPQKETSLSSPQTTSPYLISRRPGATSLVKKTRTISSDGPT